MKKGGIPMEHPKYPIQTDEEGKRRYESAKKHAQYVKEHGGSSDEIHEVFRKVMAGEGKHCKKEK